MTAGGATATGSQGVLGFDLDPAPKLSRQAFAVTEANQAAFALVQAWPNWPVPFLNLHGPGGSGKSHLARIWAERAGAQVSGLSGLDAVQPGQAVVIDDIVQLSQAEQTALFHLYNRMIGGGVSGSGVLLVSEQPLSRLVVATPDLASRLRAVPGVEIAAPDDALLQAVLRKRFDDRQLGVEQAVIDYILSRIDRSFTALEAVVDALDSRAFAQQRAITIPLAREVLALINSQYSLDL
ncbi:MAG: HdaA/DnaA family protein [Alphaproteobacteria bacterium]